MKPWFRETCAVEKIGSTKVRSITGMKRSVVCDCARRIPGSDNAGAAAAAFNSKRRETSIDNSWDIWSARLSAGGCFVTSEIRRDRLSGRDPQIGARFGIGEKFPQQTKPHRTTAALRVQHGRDHRSPIPDLVEFILPDREHVLLGKDRPWAESGGQSVHPVVITRGHRKLNRARPAVRKAMAVRPHVVPKRRGVNDAVAHQRHAQLFGEFAVRRSIAGWLDTKPTLQCLEAPLQLLLDPGVARIRQQMVIPMMADLMAGLENRLSHRGMRLRR